MSVVYSLYDALVSINVPNDKAKSVIDALEREMMDKIATKTDIDNLRVATKADIDNLRVATSADIDNLRVATSADIDNLRVATKADFDHLRVATKADIEHVRELLSKDVQNLSNAITLRMILTAVALVPAILAAQRYF